MRQRFSILLLAATAALGAALRACAGELQEQQWWVDGVRREALVSAPEGGSGPAPLVFVFHGHSGSARQVSDSIPVYRLWPEALVVYPQGLPTPGQLIDPEGRERGWQAAPGAQQDRDLRFFDAMLASLQSEHPVDRKRIYATGHSNGGGFTYLLWSQRRGVFAAFGPSGAIAGRGFRTLAPAPVIQVCGRDDPLVKFAWQSAMLSLLLKQGQCATGRPVGRYTTLYDSPIGCPVETYVYPGGHQFPTEAAAVIVAFFKDHQGP